MKTNFNMLAGVALIAALAGSMASCVSEAPFSNDGEVLVKMNVMMNSNVTRAEDNDDKTQQLVDLYDKCVVTVRSGKGVLYQWQGVQNIPGELYMRYGSYAAEAWSGDSVPAAYESDGKRFFKGNEDFTVSSASSNLQVTLNCELANVVASVEEETLDSEYVKEGSVKVTFSHPRGELSLDNSNWAEKCYFMMPVDENGQKVSTLNYIVTGTSAITGEDFTKEGVISNVKSAHEYRLNFQYDASEPTDGGAFIQILIEDKPLTIEDNVVMLGGPEFAWQGLDMTTEDQIVGDVNSFDTDYSLGIAAFNGFKSVSIVPDDDSMFAGLLPVTDGSCAFDLTNLTDDAKNNLSNLGIEITYQDNITNVSDVAVMSKYVVRFTKSWLNSFPESDSSYDLNVTAVDGNGNESTMLVSIANTKKAMSNNSPITVDTETLNSDYTSIGSKSVTLPLTFEDDADLTNAAVQYRESGTSEWSTQDIVITKTIVASVTITNLKPDTEYEYRTVAGNIENGEYELKSRVAKFTTESIFTITNASFEDWSTYSASTLLGTKTVTLPGSTGDKSTSFWGSGNEGAATANMTLTDKSEDMVHSGSYSAKLQSKTALGVLAAGNIFVGEYVKTDGTNGVLSVGREYDGSHPSAVSVYVNYRPGSSVSVKSGNEEYVPTNFEDGNDHGQIYVALTTEAVEIRTNPSNLKLFDPTGAEVIAYGEVTWTDDFGPDGELQKVEIPFTYYDNAKTDKPTHLVIVCSASKYGDYFSGSAGSVMYLDDFELVYE